MVWGARYRDYGGEGDAKRHGKAGWLTPAVLAGILIAAQLYSHTLFHVLAESFAISVAVLVAMVGLQAYPLARNHFLLFLACGYFWIGGLDLFHTLAYEGMGVFRGDTTDQSIQLWIAARATEAVVLLSAPWFLHRPPDRRAVFWGIGAISTLLAALVAAGWAPAMFIPGEGLTPLKVASEYAIILLLAGAGLHVWLRRFEMDEELARLMGISIFLTAAAEFTFTLYSWMGQWPTVAGHLLKLFSFWAIYLGMVRITLSAPLRTLARDASTFDAVPDPTVVVDAEGVIRQTNRAARQFLQREGTDSVGRHCHDLLHAPDTDRAACPVCRAVESGTPIESVEIELDGRWHQISISPLNTGAAGASGSVHVSRDITERRTVEKALQASEARFRGLVENTRDWVWEIDAEGRYTYASPQVRDLIGYAPDEVLGKTPFEFMPAAERERVSAVFGSAMARKQAFSGLENTNRHKDGHLVVLETSGVPFFDEERRLLGYRGIDRDITQRKEAESTLRESQAQLAEGEQIAGLGSWRFDAVNGKRSWSDGFYRILGLDPQSVEPSFDALCERLPEDAHEQVEAAIRQTLGGEPANLEHTIVRPDGEERVLHVQTKPTFDGSGRVTGYIGTGLDVTERKRSEQALSTQHALLQSILDAIPDFVVLKDADLNYRAVNGTFMRFIDRPLDAIIGKSDYDLFPESEAEQYRRDDRTVLQTGSSLVREEYVTGAGGQRWLQVIKVPLRDAQGGTEGVLMSVRDISALKIVEQSLRRKHAELEAVFATTHAHIAVLDSDFHFLRVNAAYADAVGRSPGELVGRNHFALFPDADNERIFRNVVASGKAYSVSSRPFRLPGQTDSTYWDWTLSPLKDSDDRVEGVMLTVIDATERERQRRQAEQAWRSVQEELERRVGERTREWERANRELEVANRELESFSYSVSHDLRGPLRAINGFTHALEEDFADSLDDQGRDYISRVRSATLRMAELIDGLLNLSRVFRAELKLERVDLSGLATESSGLLATGEPDREVTFHIEPGLIATGDVTLLRVLLQNLLGNAWKFTAGQERALVEVGRRNENGQQVFFVRDNGVGFEMQYAHKLFQPFERLHRHDEFEGTGIGLATVRRIVQRHGGEVWGEGAPGEGATIYFTLAAKAETASMSNDPAEVAIT